MPRRSKQPSHEERWNAANMKAAVAVAGIETAIIVLDESAEDQTELVDELTEEVDRLLALRARALYDQDASADVSERLRDLLGREQPR